MALEAASPSQIPRSPALLVRLFQFCTQKMFSSSLIGSDGAEEDDKVSLSVCFSKIRKVVGMETLPEPPEALRKVSPAS